MPVKMQRCWDVVACLPCQFFLGRNLEGTGTSVSSPVLARAVCWMGFIFNPEGLVYCFGGNRLLCARTFGSGSAHVGCRSCFCAPSIVVLKRTLFSCSGVASWFALVAVWPLVEEYLGRIPGLQLHAAHHGCIPTQESIQRLRRQLANLGLPLAPVTQLLMSWCSWCLRSPCPGCCGLMTPLFKGRGTPFRVAIRSKRQAPPRT